MCSLTTIIQHNDGSVNKKPSDSLNDFQKLYNYHMVACRAAALPSSEKQKRLPALRTVAFIRFLLAGLADQAEQLSFACPLLC